MGRTPSLTHYGLARMTDIVATVDVKTAFMGVDVAILVGSFPRQKGMERKDLLKKNVAIFKEQGKALNDYASRNVKVHRPVPVCLSVYTPRAREG